MKLINNEKNSGKIKEKSNEKNSGKIKEKSNENTNKEGKTPKIRDISYSNREIPLTPKPYSKENRLLEEFLTKTSHNFNAMTGFLRQKQRIFPSKSLNIRFFSNNSIFTIKKAELSQNGENVAFWLILQCKGEEFQLFLQEKMLVIPEEYHFYQYIWPLANEILDKYMKKIQILEIPCYKSIEIAVFLTKDQNSSQMQEFEALKLKEILKKLRFLLENRLFSYKKLNGTVMKPFSDEKSAILYKTRLFRMKTFINIRKNLIKTLGISFETISPSLLDYLGFVKKSCFFERKTLKNFIRKSLSFSEGIYKGFSRILSNISPISKRNSMKNQENFEDEIKEEISNEKLKVISNEKLKVISNENLRVISKEKSNEIEKIRKNFPEFLFREKAVSFVNNSIFEAKYVGFYCGELIYKQILKKNAVFFLQNISVEFSDDFCKGNSEYFMYKIGIYPLQKRKIGEFIEKITINLQDFVKKFLYGEKFDFSGFLYRKGLKKCEKVTIQSNSNRILMVENARFF